MAYQAENPDIDLGAPVASPLSSSAQPEAPDAALLPPAVAARAKQVAAAKAKRRAAYSSPEELVLAKTEQSLAPYQQAQMAAKSRVDGFGVLDRLRDPDSYAQATARLDLVRSAHEKAQALMEQRQAAMLDAARRAFEERSMPRLPSVSPAGPVIEVDPRHRTARRF